MLKLLDRDENRCGFNMLVERTKVRWQPGSSECSVTEMQSFRKSNNTLTIYKFYPRYESIRVLQMLPKIIRP
jgi:hypothetical protein